MLRHRGYITGDTSASWACDMLLLQGHHHLHWWESTLQEGAQLGHCHGPWSLHPCSRAETHPARSQVLWLPTPEQRDPAHIYPRVTIPGPEPTRISPPPGLELGASFSWPLCPPPPGLALITLQVSVSVSPHPVHLTWLHSVPFHPVPAAPTQVV